ncbi:MAG: hypothetical protein AABW89_03550 [Nanoarchaeota archaeon]
MRITSTKTLLQDISKETEQSYNPNKDFFFNISSIIDRIPISKFVYRRRVSKKKIKEFYKGKSAFVPKIKIVNGMIVGVLQEIRKGRKYNSSKEENFIRNNILFKIGNKEIRVSKRPKLFLNHMRNIFPGNVREQDIILENLTGGEFVKSLFNIEGKLIGVKLQGINTLGINVGKKVWIRIASEEKESVLDKIKKIKYGEDLIFGKKLENFKLSNMRQINFCKEDKEAKLIIVQVGIKQFRVFWKHGSYRPLIQEITAYLKLPFEGSCLILDYQNDEERIYDFFKENRVDWVKRNILYRDILQKYSSYIEVDRKEKPQLRMERIFSELNRFAKGDKSKIDKVYLKKINNIYFPRRISKKIKKEGLKQSNCFFRITNKEGKIIQHFFLDHEFLDKHDVKEFLDSYFIFHPLVSLDFRANGDLEPFSINTGIFLKNLKDDPKKAYQMILRDKDSISANEREIYFNNSRGHLDKMDEINYKLSNQQKGAYFEAICFGVLSQIFLTRRIGNRLNPDGKFILEDEKVLYDAKNLKTITSTNTLLQSITKKNGQIKDIEYIKNGNVKKYLFIVKELNEKDFIDVKAKIESSTSCKVSAIEIGLLRKIVEYYLEDPLKFSIRKLNAILFSGELKNDINKKEVTNSI